MRADEKLRPVVTRLLETRRAKIEETQGGTPRAMRVLFTGHSEKNKLLAAQLFANELAVDLYEIDLQRMVSKYLGDTEKNLDALFAAAEASDAVLLFEDSAHLFGETVSPEDSGRFPNLDIAHLRQRIEKYEGVVVLATNSKESIDPKIARQCDEVVDLG